MSLADSLSEFRAGIAQTNNFISMAYEHNANGNEIFDSSKKEFLNSTNNCNTRSWFVAIAL